MDLSQLRHDLRTPLNQMLGYSEMLLEDAQDQPEVAQELQEILDGSKRLLSLVSKVLAVDGVSLDLIRSELQAPLDSVMTQAQNLLAKAKHAGLANLLPDLQKIATAAGNLDALLRSAKIETGKNAPPPSILSLLPSANFSGKPAAILPGRILVVDDSEMNRDMLCRRLDRQGHKYVCAENGRQALDVLAQSDFDLVLLDIIMPKMDGYQVLNALKNDPKLRHLPVIMLSALDEIESVVHCIEMGADDYLPKPFNPVLLKARIGACLEKKHLRDKERRYLEQLQMEQEKSERLLLNVLPKEIADRLKGGEEAIADHFADVTILFADLVGFTTISQRMSAVDLVNLLNEIFSAFDHLAARHGLEKIKTIGDAYMVAGGLPVSRPGHAESIAEMALDMQQEINRFNEKYNTQIQIRIGINTGPVIAGIIGRNKFIYDLWGDTVNTASRMESHCVADGIQVTEKTRSYLDSKYVFQDRGKIEVKGKGGMQVYLLAGRKGSLE